MSCFYPLWRSHRGETFKVPCGRCIGCRMDHAKKWAVRCMLEAQMHEHNCFVTLTYNNEHLPSDGSVSKREMQLFMKRLRERVTPIEVRFYGCGEYGENMGRPHYHILLFGFDFPDKEPIYVSCPETRKVFAGATNDYSVYKSQMLDSLWGRGFTSLGEVSLESAGYVARYIRKKVGGAPAIEHYGKREVEFSLMSRKPGIGAEWFKRYWNDFYPKDFTTIDGRKFKPPRYFDNLLMRHDWLMYEAIKELRKQNVVNPDIIRRRAMDKHMQSITRRLERRLEHE